MNFSLLFGLGLLLVDIIIRVVAYNNRLGYVPDFGFFYIGILNVIAGLVLKHTPSLIFKIIVSSCMFLTILYPISQFLEPRLGWSSFVDLMGFLGLWSGATGIIFLLFTPMEEG